MRRTFRPAVGIAVLAAVVVSGSASAEEWTEPKDGLFTEKQLVNFAAAQKEVVQMLKAMGKAMEGSKSGVGAITMIAGMDDKVNAILVKHDLKRPEYDWLTNQTFRYLGVAMMDSMLDASKNDLAAQKKKNTDDVAAAKAKVAEYEKAKKDGTRVLTKEQRDEALKNAAEAKKSAEDEARQHAEEAKAAADEAARFEADAKAADALAKRPPADVTADAREDYVAARKAEVDSAKGSAKDARDREAEARKAMAESKAKADASARSTAHPEIPTTDDDDKAQVQKDNEEGLANAKGELDTLVQAGQLLADTDAPLQKQRDDAHKDIKEPNLALVKKHLTELQDVWGMKK